MLKIVCILLWSFIHVQSVAIPKIDSSESIVTETIDNELDHTERDLVQPNVCTSEICLKESARIVSSLNVSVDPCENFYEFVCGKYIHDTVLPEHKYKESAFSLVQDQIDKQLEEALFEEPQPNEPKAFQLAKTFAKICMDTATMNQKGIQPLVDILEQYGGWPVVKGDEWQSNNWSWLEMSKNMSNDGLPANFFLDTSVGPDLEDTNKNILKIGRADPGLDKELLMRGVNDSNVQAYLAFMVDVAVMFGANRTQALDEMTDVLLFEEILVKVSLKQYYVKFTIEELNSFYTQMNWTEFINWNLNNIHRVYENETVVFYDGIFVDKLVSTIDTVSKRTVANYLAWRLVLTSSGYLNDDLRKLYYQFQKTKYGVLQLNPRSVQCARQTMKFLPIATGAMYVRRFFDEKSRKIAISVAKEIHKEFIETLKQVPWLDDESREAAIVKANAMKFHIGYPDALMNDTILDEYYNDLELQTDSFLHSMLRAQKFNTDHAIGQLRKSVNKNDWIEHSLRLTSVDAFYSVIENSIQIPASILQDRFFSADRPSYMNFGSIGFFFGHEITHGFDDDGRRFDANSNMVDWWQSDTVDKFDSKAECFIDQYSNYSNPALNITVDGEHTQSENIADNGGIKVAYAAYQKYVEKNGPDPVLPELNYTANQMFWISGAQLWCTVTRPEYDKTQITTNEHTPFNYRIIGAFSNSERFSKDFNCVTGSGMNPVNKCEIW